MKNKTYEIYKRIRKIFTFNPSTKVVDKDKKKKNRAKRKQEFKKELKDEL